MPLDPDYLRSLTPKAKRRRYATRAELVDLVANTTDLPAAHIEQVLDKLAELGAPVDALVRIEVDEP